MIYTYKKYREKSNTLLFEEAEEIYEKILSEIELSNDISLNEIWEEVIKNSLEYSLIRAEWLILSREIRMSRNLLRTLKHNTLISSFDMLSRYMDKIGKNIDWRKDLGDERQRIGDLASYISFIYSLNGR